ncbi:MAG: ankyrin repeat domain-containing protein [Candidatus Hydrogenedentes bacterium]|nr:ankyrin repeat domain-containing protein [Candidatus Hydrogenedentota bacterium]
MVQSLGRAIIILSLALCLAACGNAGVNGRRDVLGRLALHQAVDSGDIAAVQALFEKGAQVNVTDLDGVTPLHRCARDGNLQMAELLLQHRADPNIKTRDGWSPVHLAVWHRHAAMANLILSYGGLATEQTPEGWAPLHLAAMRGMTDVIDMLYLDWESSQTHGKPDPNAADKEGNSPLFLALAHREPAVVEQLLVKGADPNQTGKGGNRPLHLLVGTNSAFLVNKFLQYGADVNGVNGQGLTPYALAYEKGDVAVGEALWNAGGR